MCMLFRHEIETTLVFFFNQSITQSKHIYLYIAPYIASEYRRIMVDTRASLRNDLLCVEQDVKLYSLTGYPVSYTHLTLPTNREV